jgi:hypothetical protein
MHKSKTKPDSLWSARSLLFIVLWASSYRVTESGGILLSEMLASILPRPRAGIIALCLAVLFLHMVHMLLVEKILRRSMRGWIAYSLVGSLITFFTYNATIYLARGSLPSLYGDIPPNLFNWFVFYVALVLPLPLMQAVWLWRRVRAAWLWPLLSVVVAFVFAFVIPIGRIDGIPIMTALLLQGITMRYLWTQTRYTEKAKVDFDVDSQANVDTRAARLQTSESLPVTWHTRDEQAAQRRDQ